MKVPRSLRLSKQSMTNHSLRSKSSLVVLLDIQNFEFVFPCLFDVLRDQLRNV